ncbi:MAG: putative aconitase with swiveling domain [Rhodothermales bacterium]|jgi:predicted aconitase with swiveling domain
MGFGMSIHSGRVLVAGSATGEALHLQQDLSFWGAVDPLEGRIIDSRHPQFGISIEGKILLMHRSIGSSSGSAILLETLYRGCGPAGIILGEADQILTLGAVIAREMGYATIPVIQFDVSRFGDLQGQITILSDGNVKTNEAQC